MQSKFLIGEMSRLHNISKQTLIFYDKMGILKPNKIDEKNGYRYYTLEQFEELDTILTLKEIGMNLNDIKEYLNRRTLNNSIELLEEQDNYLEKRIEELSDIRKKINKKMKILNRTKKIQEEKVVIEEKYMEEEYIIAMEVKPPYDSYNIEIAVKRLFDKLEELHLNYTYELGSIVQKENLYKGDYHRLRWVFNCLNEYIDRDDVIIKPKGKYISIYHRGPYDETEKSYNKLLEYIREKGYKIIGDSYELDLIDNFSVSSEKEYLTELSILVES